jgi:APA family basic amino acid/polyamine antiporter
MSSLGSLAAFAAVNLALIRLRITLPRRERPFRVPLAVRSVPVLPVLGTIGIGVLLFQFDALTYVVVGVALAGGLVLYALRRATAS